MSIYVGMDVHRKRSQIAVVDDAGEEQREPWPRAPSRHLTEPGPGD